MRTASMRAVLAPSVLRPHLNKWLLHAMPPGATITCCSCNMPCAFPGLVPWQHDKLQRRCTSSPRHDMDPAVHLARAHWPPHNMQTAEQTAGTLLALLQCASIQHLATRATAAAKLNLE